jgi:NAD(P)-dependent dehydrogenase (short-subunit alcohol dehydrogenase family)/rhamnose utilization protein RhaD (predicted bifunctional aldolase and dehydrogenase)
MEKQLTQLVKISNKFGTNDFALAGGGNTSYKNKEFICVKASGTRLVSITEKGFVKLYRDKLSSISSRTYSQNPDERESQVKSDLYKSIVSLETTLRPSVETSIHDLINYSFVVHTHPTLINGLLCSNNARKAFSDLFAEKAIFIEYTDPGYTLFKKIEKLILEYRTKYNCDPKMIFLQNHGIFVSANTTEEIESLYKEVISAIKTKIKHSLPSGHKKVDAGITEILPGIRAILSTGSSKILKIRNNKLISHYINDSSRFSKIDRPFSPDIIVYCKASYLFIDLPQNTPPGEYLSFFKGKYEEFVKTKKFVPKVIILKGIGIVGVEDSAAAVETVLDVYEDLLKISFYSENFGGPHFMSPEQINFIDNWEVENYRRQISAGSGVKGKVQGKIAIVTGGAQGFGEGIVKDLFSEGANVVIADIKAKEGEKLAESLNNSGKKNKAHFVHTDVSDFKSLQNLVYETVVNFGGLNITVSNAGILRAGSIEEMEIDTFELMTRINYSAYFMVIKAVTPVLKLQTKYQPGLFTDIIQINSKSGLRGSNKNFTYAGGKFGGVGLTQSFALELMPYHIKVNAICPGNFFDGPLWSDPVNGLFMQYLKTGKVPGAKTIEDVRKFYEMQVPAQRGCRVEDVMKAIYYVIEQEYETGQAIPVTGGQIMLG